MGFALDHFFSDGVARLLWRDLGYLVSPDPRLPRYEFTDPPKEGTYAASWKEVIAQLEPYLDDLLKPDYIGVDLKLPKSEQLAWAKAMAKERYRSAAWQLMNVLEKWDESVRRSDASQRGAILQALMQRYADLKNRLPEDKVPVSMRAKYIQPTASIMAGIMVRMECAFRKEDFNVTLKKFELAHTAEAPIRLDSELRLDPRISPGAYWKAKHSLLPDSVTGINKEVLEDLAKLEDPNSTADEKSKALDRLRSNFGKIKEALSGRGYTKEDMSALLPIIAETCRGISAPPESSGGRPGARSSGPILTIAMPDLLTPARDRSELTDQEMKKEIAKEVLRKQNERLAVIMRKR
jgi:hypothetical protein